MRPLTVAWLLKMTWRHSTSVTASADSSDTIWRYITTVSMRTRSRCDCEWVGWTNSCRWSFTVLHTHTHAHAHAHVRTHAHAHTHTHNRLTALCPGLPGWAGTRRNIHPLTSILYHQTSYQLPPSFYTDTVKCPWSNFYFYLWHWNIDYFTLLRSTATSLFNFNFSFNFTVLQYQTIGIMWCMYTVG